MLYTYTYAIKDENGEITVGGNDNVAEVGDTLTVVLNDENGNEIEATGEVVEVLE